MNIGIITASKEFNYGALPNNTYLIFYVTKKNYNQKYLEDIVSYMITNDCIEIIVPKSITPLLNNDVQKKASIYNDFSKIHCYSNTKRIITYNFSLKYPSSVSFEKSFSYRKDKKPDETIQKIKDIIKRENYNVKEKGLRRSLKGSYSIRLELNNGKGSNGKGTTLKLAKASAYAELMERIQSNMLIKKRVSTNTIDKKHRIYNILLKNASTEYKKMFFTLDDIYFNVSEARNIKSNKTELIPVNAISSFCHTNGLASGNTFEEAINQGIFEILERFCYQEYLKGKKQIRNIDISNYPLTRSNKTMLNCLEKRGFSYYIKDCSLGKYPVVGFLLFNKNKQKYSFTIGSDISFNIALSRCITEMMQGVNFKELEEKMLPNMTLEELESKYDSSYISYNWLRCFNNNNGYLPKNFFTNESIPVPELFFKDYMTSNYEVLEYMKKVIDNDIYVVDYNSLGFDTYRIYIPHMTNVDCYDINDLIINTNYDRLKKIYTNILTVPNGDIAFFVNTFLKITKDIKYDELIKPADVFHVDETSDYYKLDFTSLLIVLTSLCSKTDKLKEYLNYKINNIPLNSKKELAYKITVNYLERKKCYDVNDDDISHYIENIFQNTKDYLISLNPSFNNNESLIQNKRA